MCELCVCACIDTYVIMHRIWHKNQKNRYFMRPSHKQKIGPNILTTSSICGVKVMTSKNTIMEKSLTNPSSTTAFKAEIRRLNIIIRS